MGAGAPESRKAHSLSPRIFTRHELEEATSNFSNRIGRGGFGEVWRGKFMGRDIAVKCSLKGRNTYAANESLLQEIIVLGKQRHRNVVSLIGYMIDDNDFMLVYEYAAHGSLADHLFAKKGVGVAADPVLAWERRWSVAVGVANGMEYLHEDQRKGCIIHRDLRSANILLDHNFEPLVADFGLAKRLPVENYASMTNARGCFGYIAPEYAMTGKVTAKSDVYSYGIVLLELLTGEKVLDERREEISLFYRANKLWDQMGERAWEALLDPRLVLPPADDYHRRYLTVTQIKCVAELAQQCVNLEFGRRPTFSKVVGTLMDVSCEGFVPLPPRVPFAPLTGAPGWSDEEAPALQDCISPPSSSEGSGRGSSTQSGSVMIVGRSWHDQNRFQ